MRSRLLLVLVFTALLVGDGWAKRPKKLPKFAFDRDDNPMNIPLVVNIFLMGFDGLSGSGLLLPSDKLEQFLFDIFPQHHPVCQDTGEKLHVAFEIWYNVVPVHNNYFEKTYSIMKSELKELGETVLLKPETEDGSVTEVPLYEIAVEGPLQDHLQNVFEEHAKVARYKTKDSEHRRAYGIFILNPDKSQFTPGNIPNKPFAYRYKTVGTGMSSAFVSNSRFAVLDLGAGPSHYGHTDAAEGTVTEKSFPNPKKFVAKEGDAKEQEILQNSFLAQLGRPIISAIKHIFAPDIKYDALDYSEKVLVPVVVLRNHLRFDPLEGGHPYSINTTRIYNALKMLALPGQEIEIVYGLHSIGDHESISIAVERASKSSTIHEPKDGKFRLKTSHYLDSTLLMNDLSLASDYLASGLLSSSKTLKKAYFPDEFAENVQGTRVLPVFVLSLISDGEPLLFDRTALHASSKDMVLVLQNNVDDLILPYFSESWNVEGSAVDPTPHIIAGLAEAIAGLTPPYVSYSSLHKRLVYDYTWAVGFHPFGPFSNETHLTELHVDMALRNSIISRCDAALSKIQDAMSTLQKFSEFYLIDPWGSELQDKPPPRSRIVEYLYKNSENAGNLGRKVVTRLHEDLMSLQSMFEETAEVLYYLDLTKAHTLSDRIFRKASTFHKYVLNELDIADNALFCCSMDHTVVARTNWPLILRCAIGGLFGAAVVLLVLGYTPANPAQLARRLNPKRFKQNIH